MKNTMKSTISTVFIIFLLLLPLLALPIEVEGESKSSGNITFQPNIIPNLVVTERTGRNNESFRFEWLGNRFDIELFFNATRLQEGVNVTKLWSLEDFEEDFGVTVNYVANKNVTHCQFGWVVDNVESVSNLVHNAWFKIEDTQPFDYDDIEIIEGLEENETSAFYLPDNLVLSFEDLEHKGFIIGHQNKTSMNVKGFSGKSSWDLDPITYSDPTITVDGTYDSEANWHVWNASNVNGWGAVFNYDNMTYFYNSSKLVIGDDVNPASFKDENVQMVFNVTTEVAIRVNHYATFQVGNLEDETNKVTSGGCSILFDLAGGANDVAFYAVASSTTKFYGCTLASKSHHSVVYIYHSSAYAYVYNTLFVGLAFRMYYSRVDAYRITQTAGTLGSGTGLDSPYSLYMTLNVILIEGNCYALYAATSTIRNLVARNNTYLLVNWHPNHPTTYLIDADIDNWLLQMGELYGGEGIFRQYSFVVTVTYPNGTLIENANITIGHYGNETGYTQDYTVLTGTNGSHAEQIFTKGYWVYPPGLTGYQYLDETDMISKNPYNLQITNITGYQDYSGNFSLPERKGWIIALQPAGKSAGWMLAGLSILILICVVAGVIGVVRRH